MELLANVVSRINPNREGFRPCIDYCGTRKSGSPIWALQSTPPRRK
jgi:hypothetical protein